jgi:hypothetical protein
VRLNPGLQARPIENAGSDLKNRLLGLVYRGLDPTAIEPKKRDHRGITDPLVAIACRRHANAASDDVGIRERLPDLLSVFRQDFLEWPSRRRIPGHAKKLRLGLLSLEPSNPPAPYVGTVDARVRENHSPEGRVHAIDLASFHHRASALVNLPEAVACRPGLEGGSDRGDNGWHVEPKDKDETRLLELKLKAEQLAAPTHEALVLRAGKWSSVVPAKAHEEVREEAV